MYIIYVIYIYAHIYKRTAKYLFEFEKVFFNLTYIFMYTVSFCNIYVVAQIDEGTISIISIVTQILRPILLMRGF